ncbi:MAG: hypothetical protein WA364_30740 [Candidatus Nitrosopolaris sp.]
MKGEKTFYGICGENISLGLLEHYAGEKMASLNQYRICGFPMYIIFGIESVKKG